MKPSILSDLSPSALRRKPGDLRNRPINMGSMGRFSKNSCNHSFDPKAWGGSKIMDLWTHKRDNFKVLSVFFGYLISIEAAEDVEGSWLFFADGPKEATHQVPGVPFPNQAWCLEATRDDPRNTKCTQHGLLQKQMRQRRRDVAWRPSHPFLVPAIS